MPKSSTVLVLDLVKRGPDPVPCLILRLGFSKGGSCLMFVDVDFCEIADL